MHVHYVLVFVFRLAYALCTSVCVLVFMLFAVALRILYLDRLLESFP